MCYPVDALPPAVPEELVFATEEQVGRPEQLRLTPADGSEFTAAGSRAPEPLSADGPLVVVLLDVRGLFPFYSELTRRFASAGYHAVAIDYFGRTAEDDDRGAEFEWLPHVKQTKPEQVQADVATAVAALTTRTETTRAVTVGFCFGGSQSYLASRNRDLDLAGVIALYGGLDGTRLGAFPSPVDLADDMQGPILGLFGGEDPSISAELVARFDKGLSDAGVEHEFVTYEGAPHSFFDRSFVDHGDDCQDAWRRVLGFLARV